MFTQKSYFRILSLSVLFFFARTLTAVSPHKTGAQVVGESSDAYSEAFWTGFGVTCLCLLALAAFKMVQGEKSQRYEE